MVAWDKNLRKNVMKFKNKYYIMRHGQAVSNVKALCSCWPEKFHNPLTKVGRQMVKESAMRLKKSGGSMDLIFNSPLLRGVQTAAIVGKIFKVKPKVDKRLREIGFGEFNGKNLEGMWKSFKHEYERVRKGADGGETYTQILARMIDVVKDAEKKYKGKNIMFISHEGPLGLLQGKAMGLSIKGTIDAFPLAKRIHKGEIRKLN